MRKDSIVARTITLKIRFGNFETRTRARTVPEATDLSTEILATVKELLVEFDVARGVRLLGVSLSHLSERPTVQPTLDLNRRAAVEDAVDQVRDRFGTQAVLPARLTGPERRP
jgi:DNA polymerase-4